MSKHNNTLHKGKGSNCPRCGSVMEIQGHKQITPKMLKQQYYFTEWERCYSCNFFLMKESCKVFN